MPPINCHCAVKENWRRWKYIHCCNKKEKVCRVGEYGFCRL